MNRNRAMLEECETSPDLAVQERCLQTVQGRRRLAVNLALVHDLQAILARDNSWAVRYGLAHNPALVHEVQAILARDDWSGVRHGLARNPSIVHDVQVILARDDIWEVRRALALNTTLTDPLARCILRRQGYYLSNPKCAADASSWGCIARAPPEDQEMALAEGFAHCPESFVDAGWQWWQSLNPAEREQHAPLRDELVSRGTLRAGGGPILL